MSDGYKQFEQRKQDHIALALAKENQALESNRLDALYLVHEALPDLDFEAVDMSSQRLGVAVEKPFMVASMTAGHHQAETINHHLLAACSETGWAMGVGSQRRELTDPEAGLVWQTLRRDFPSVELYGNLGIAQLITTPLDTVRKLTDTLEASALMIHCNALQECIQPEGTPQFKGCFEALEALVKAAHVPVIIKETGCGFSQKTLMRLNNLGVAAVDVSGLGGTHWGRIEGHRAPQDSLQHAAAKSFQNWGVDTPQSVQNAVSLSPNFEVWGSGGVRNGLDAAKLLALGASTIGFAKPMLQAATESKDAVIRVMKTIEYELRVALFCTGSQNISELGEALRC